MNLSIVIPAYNEENNIKIIIDEILHIISNIPEITTFQIHVIDDHSNDNTFDAVTQLQDSNVSCLRLSRNSGSHIALRAGIAHSQGDCVLCISADGQDNPNILGEMIKKWEKGIQIVWALYTHRRGHFLNRWFSLMFYKILKRLTSVQQSHIDISKAAFYLIDRRVVDAINQCPERNTSLFGLINWLGFKQDCVEFKRRERKSGKSKWSFRSRLHLAKDWIVAFSGLPLKLMTIIGLFVSLIGFLYAMFIFIFSLIGNPIKGWASTMVVILILGGLQMLMLGIVGEYLWRNLNESKKRPLYIIEKSTWEKTDE